MTEERKEIEAQLGQRENLALAHGVEPTEKRVNLVKREQRAVQGLDIQEQKVTLDLLDPLGPLALQVLQLST